MPVLCKIADDVRIYQVVYINKSALKVCSDLEFLSLSDTLKFAGCHFFFNCEKLKNVSIPPDVECIQYGVLYQCLSLK